MGLRSGEYGGRKIGSNLHQLRDFPHAAVGENFLPKVAILRFLIIFHYLLLYVTPMDTNVSYGTQAVMVTNTVLGHKKQFLR